MTKFFTLFLLPLSILADPLPATNRIDWTPGQTVGVVGGIPTVSTMFCNIKVSIPGSPLVAAGNGVTDDTAAFQAAYNLCPSNQFIYVPDSTYNLAGSVFVNRDGIVLRGQSVTNTVLHYSGSSGLGAFQIGNQGSILNDQAIVSGYAKGSSNIVVADTTSFTVTSPILIYQNVNDDWVIQQSGGTSPQQTQLRNITAVTGTTVTFWPPLNYANPAKSPRVHSKQYWFTIKAGFETFTIERDGISDGNIFLMTQCLNCWFKDVEVRKWRASGILATACLNCEVRDSYIHDTWANPGSGGGYGLQLFNDVRLNSWTGCHNWLIENNRFYKCGPSFIMSGSSSGNVIGYNYSYYPKPITNSLGVTQGTIQSDFNANHASFNSFNLFEGNIGTSWQSDGFHGGSGMLTTFRNAFGLRIPDPMVQYYRCIDGCRWDYFDWHIANVLGDPTIFGYWYDPSEMPGPPNGYTIAQPVIYRFGYPNIGNTGYSGTQPPYVNDQGYDTQVLANVHRAGNFDYASGNVNWDGGISNTNLPSSYYQSGQPSWWLAWGATPWPAIGPDRTPMVSPIPAQLRFSGASTPSINPGKLSWSSTTYSVAEGGFLAVTVARQSGTNGAVSVTVTTANGTAMAGHDYTTVSTALTWADGATGARSVTIPILASGDTATTNRTFTVTLSGITGGATLLGSATSTVTIVMNPPPVPPPPPPPTVVQFANSSYSISVTNTPITLTVQRAGPNNIVSTVNYATVNGSAVAGTDYTAASGVIMFPSGATSQPISVTIIPTGTVGPPRSFTVTLTNPSNCSLGLSTAAVSIIENTPISVTVTIQGQTTLRGSVIVK